MSNTSRIDNRIIAFDLLRVAMLLLLFVIHAAMSFMSSEVNPEIWAFKDLSTHVVFDGLVSFIHLFRLPIFLSSLDF